MIDWQSLPIWPGLPDWIVALGLFAAAVGLGWLAHAVVHRIVQRIVARWDLFWRSLVIRTRGPARFALIILFLAIAARIAPLTDHQVVIVQRILLIGFIVLLAWSARTALEIWSIIHVRRFRLDTSDNLMARKHVTQLRIMRRLADTAITVVGIAAVLMTFDGVRQYGVSLLASAGAAGIIVGLALQPFLKNVFAGIQLALTQPIRIDDAVIVEGEWGNIEEITSTYVVVRIWDRRRLIVPLGYFIEKPFQNWTREEARLIGSVMIYLDYSVPVKEIRAAAERIAGASALWDKDVVSVQVTNFRETVMEVRVLVSAANSGEAFSLRCEMREKLATFLRDNYPETLPRLRLELDRAARLPALEQEAADVGSATRKAPDDEHSQPPA